ncbi:glycoside hydrolase [Massilia rhizosphaerae]|uniref:glycoside hydrolase n=1 Tax=Massilia rhizosphaerae TaxID=2784389 RepID=UPI0018DBC744|nr:glycoside hydrolase [Massilia rhizosphaerae]
MISGALRIFSLRCMVLIGLCFLASSAGAENNDEKPVNVRAVVNVDWRHPGPPFEGWGTALAWFANVTGRFAEPRRTELADLLYGRDGLALNIARYNIGGGNAPGTPSYLRPGGDIPGFWRKPAEKSGTGWWNPDAEDAWDWSADTGQRWWLDAIKERVTPQELILEAFSNSPPYFMTRSGLVSGNVNALEDNLIPGFETKFSRYLARVTAELERRHGIRFRTLSPINEPNTPYWFSTNRQEGAHWSPEAQSRMFIALAQVLRERGMKTEISGPDETNPQTFFVDWAGLSADAKAVIRQINVHSYEWIGKSGVRDIAETSGKRLWMSEVDLSPSNVREDINDMRPAIALAQQIVTDINSMNPQAWILWQAIENRSSDPKNSSNWGLIKADFSNLERPEYRITKKFWAFANFTKFIRPGYRFLKSDDPDALVAEHPETNEVVIVVVNPGIVSRMLDIRLPDAKRGKLTCKTFITREKDNLATLKSASCAVRLSVHSLPMSVVTVVATPHK